ncbi:MAG: cupredoxin domain-containing protein [Bradyrhizobium sp.]
MSIQIMTTKTLALAAICALLPAALALTQPVANVQLTYSHGAFQPKEVHAPANRPVAVYVMKNVDAKAMEFESNSLRVEKVAAKTQGIDNARPLSPGRHQFYDDSNQQARGIPDRPIGETSPKVAVAPSDSSSLKAGRSRAADSVHLSRPTYQIK